MNVDSAFYENNFSLIQVISNRRVIVERVSNQKKKEFQYSFLTIILKIISTVKKIKQIIVTALKKTSYSREKAITRISSPQRA